MVAARNPGSACMCQSSASNADIPHCRLGGQKLLLRTTWTENCNDPDFTFRFTASERLLNYVSSLGTRVRVASRV